jgi:hypothetical protein
VLHRKMARFFWYISQRRAPALEQPFRWHCPVFRGVTAWLGFMGGSWEGGPVLQPTRPTLAAAGRGCPIAADCWFIPPGGGLQSVSLSRACDLTTDLPAPTAAPGGERRPHSARTRAHPSSVSSLIRRTRSLSASISAISSGLITHYLFIDGRTGGQGGDRRLLPGNGPASSPDCSRVGPQFTSACAGAAPEALMAMVAVAVCYFVAGAGFRRGGFCIRSGRACLPWRHDPPSSRSLRPPPIWDGAPTSNTLPTTRAHGLGGALDPRRSPIATAAA